MPTRATATGTAATGAERASLRTDISSARALRSSKEPLMDSTRRTVLATGVAAAAAAAVPQAFGQTHPGKGAAMSFFEKGSVRIHYEEVGSRFPLLLIPGGGLNSTIGWMAKGAPFNAIEEFKNELRIVAADMRTAYDGQSTGPLESDRPWDAYTDDQLALMDHLGHKKFMVMGFCIGGPFVWNLLKRAPDPVVAGVAAQPSGFRPELPSLSYDTNIKGWGPEIVKRRPDISMDAVDRFLTKMYRGAAADFVYTVSRDFVRSCKTPVLVMPDDSPPHPYAVAMESVMLAPKSEVSLFPWKEPKDRVAVAVRQARSFLRAHRPETA